MCMQYQNILEVDFGWVLAAMLKLILIVKLNEL